MSWKWARDYGCTHMERWYPCGDVPCREAVSYYPREGEIVISEYGKNYDNLAVAIFKCKSFNMATLLVNSVKRVESH